MGRGTLHTLLSLFLAGLAMLPFASALAVSYPYLDANTLPLTPGSVHHYPLTIQNEEDLLLRAKVTIESPIATLLGPSELDLAPKTYDTLAYIQITIPPDAPIDTTYTVRYIIEPVGKRTDAGQVPFSVKYDRSLTVKVVQGTPTVEPTPEIPGLTGVVTLETGASRLPYLIPTLIVLTLIGALLWRAAKRASRKSAPPKEGPGEP